MIESLSVDESHTNELGGQPASFWRRLGGALIDGIVLSIVDGILRAIFKNPGQALGLLVTVGYFTYLHGKTGQTPGNAVLGIKVVDVRDRPGRPIGYGRAALRWLVSIVSLIVFLLGYLWMLWDPKKQTWHDKASGSVPVHLGT